MLGSESVCHVAGIRKQPGKLRATISEALPLYILPKDPVVDEVLIPALQASTSLDIMMGYFSSGSFAEIAPGLATFLRNGTTPMRMVISPFLSDTDFDAFTENKDNLLRLAERLIFDDVPSEDILARHTLECLAWLITQGRLSIQVAIMRDALFHHKVWLFSDAHDCAALHGSTNFTRRGLTKNREQLTLSRGWMGEEAVFHIKQLRREFENLWLGGDKGCYVVNLSDAIERKIVERYKTEMIPNENKIERIWEKANRSLAPLGDDVPKESGLKIRDNSAYGHPA